MQFLTLERVVAIHDDVVSKTGGVSGVLSQGTLEGCIERYSTDVFGFVPFAGLFEKAAALMHCITFFHGFNDGNKRTGLQVTGIFLALNGYYLSTGSDAVTFSMRVASGLVEVDEIVEWLITNSTFFGESG